MNLENKLQNIIYKAKKISPFTGIHKVPCFESTSHLFP
jgi:hypothetical protein